MNSDQPVDLGRTAIKELIDGVLTGERRAVGRLISLIEDGSPYLSEITALLAPHVRGVRVVGLTGAPGVGKSTSTAALVAAFRRQGLRVGVLAIDPSSPFSGGALLGDRIRMGDHTLDPGVFVRSMATRGRLGGLAWSTQQVLRVLDVAGADVVLVETVGVGQAEIDIASLADTTLVLVAPGMGDAIQAAKAGILEVADILVVNKADRADAAQTARQLEQMLAMNARSDSWRPPVVSTVATRAEGLDDLVTAITRHGSWLSESGEGQRRRIRRAADEIREIAASRLRGAISSLRDGEALASAASAVASGRSDPYTAAGGLLTEWGENSLKG